MSEQHSNLAFEDGITGEPSELWRLHATRKTPATLKDIPHINWFATEEAAHRHAAWINDGRGEVLAIDKYVKAAQLTAAQQRVAELQHDNHTAAMMLQRRDADNEQLKQRVAELERLLRGIQQDAKLGDDEYHLSMSLIMAIDYHIGLNAGEQVIVPNYAADNARLQQQVAELQAYIEQLEGRRASE